MTWLLTNLIATLLLPPCNGLLPALAGWGLLRRRPGPGRVLIGLGLVLLTVQSLPVVSWGLLRVLERQHAPLPVAALDALPVDAGVVLSASLYAEAPELGGDDDVFGLSLERIRYGALVARRSGQPLLLAGGRFGERGASLAQAMKVAVERDFGVPVAWLEEHSTDTRQNALGAAGILLPEGRRRIALVTHAYHMPRAVLLFARAGFAVTPAPTVFIAGPGSLGALDFLPNYQSGTRTGLALHELIGLLWARLHTG